MTVKSTFFFFVGQTREDKGKIFTPKMQMRGKNIEKQIKIITRRHIWKQVSLMVVGTSLKTFVLSDSFWVKSFFTHLLE